MRKKFSTILDESIIKKVKIYSVILDKPINEIIEDALKEYIEKLDSESERQ
jgi:DNA-binding protein Fis